MKVDFPETRGRKRKHIFKDMVIGESQTVKESVVAISSSAIYWARQKGYRIRCYTDPETSKTTIIRIG